jgi:hypothetical protein
VVLRRSSTTAVGTLNVEGEIALIGGGGAALPRGESWLFPGGSTGAGGGKGGGARAAASFAPQAAMSAVEAHLFAIFAASVGSTNWLVSTVASGTAAFISAALSTISISTCTSLRKVYEFL